jgi:hypothetical protein
VNKEINRLIIESSIVFVSIFATIGLLIGVSANQFKTTYIYFGYMLYYALPFMLSCSFGIVSMLFGDENRKASDLMSIIGVSWFVTGLSTLVFLASSATQTSQLPTTFTFLLPYPSVPFLEFVVFSIIFGVMTAGGLLISASKRVFGRRDWLLGISSVIFIIGIVIMMMFGVRQTSYFAGSNVVFLAGASSQYPFRAVNFTLDSSDQAFVQMHSLDNESLSYDFFDEGNYRLYNDSSTRISANPINWGNYGNDFSFTVTATASSNYYLVMKSEYFLGTNVTYSIKVFKIDNSVEVAFLFVSVASLSVLLATSISKAKFNYRALVIDRSIKRVKRDLSVGWLA